MYNVGSGVSNKRNNAIASNLPVDEDARLASSLARHLGLIYHRQSRAARLTTSEQSVFDCDSVCLRFGRIQCHSVSIGVVRINQLKTK